MSAHKLENSWNNIIEMTSSIEGLAAESKWQDIATIATQRHKDITTHFQDFPVGPETAQFYSKHLSHFLEKEEILQELVKSARKEVLKAGTIINNRKKLSASYG